MADTETLLLKLGFPNVMTPKQTVTMLTLTHNPILLCTGLNKGLAISHPHPH